MQRAHIVRDQALHEHQPAPRSTPGPQSWQQPRFFPHPRASASGSFIHFPLPGSCSAPRGAELPESKRPHAFSPLGQASLAAPNAAGRSALAGCAGLFAERFAHRSPPPVPAEAPLASGWPGASWHPAEIRRRLRSRRWPRGKASRHRRGTELRDLCPKAWAGKGSSAGAAVPAAPGTRTASEPDKRSGDPANRHPASRAHGEERPERAGLCPAVRNAPQSARSLQAGMGKLQGEKGGASGPRQHPWVPPAGPALNSWEHWERRQLQGGRGLLKHPRFWGPAAPTCPGLDASRQGAPKQQWGSGLLGSGERQEKA